jgi:hypothetical protein
MEVEALKGGSESKRGGGVVAIDRTGAAHVFAEVP